jgi:uncharacterized protein (TIGR02611 family)
VDEGSAEPAAGVRVRRERGRLHRRLHANPALALTTKIVVTTIGVLVICAGLVMMVAPGPGIVGIAVGLAILATEYDWAEHWLQKAKDKAQEAKTRAEKMDPKVRRRRVIVAVIVAVVLAAAVGAYVATYDWPTPAVDGWNWVQGLAGWMPELPGM